MTALARRVDDLQTGVDVVHDVDTTWTPVYDAERVMPDRGIAVLVGGVAIAVFRLAAFDGGGEEWHAVSHLDPMTGAPVMARGLVGSHGTPPLVVPTLASPLHKQRYDMRTGDCLDDSTVRLETYPVRVHGGQVEVGAPVTSP
jgi:nitrite reductase (NADH) small subunit